MPLLYPLFIHLFTLALHLAAPFHAKARRWVAGRRDWRTRYRAEFQRRGRVLWVHAASLGEFEQGRPVIEAFREKFPDWQVVLTFFSPSGYEIRKNYPHADFVAYLPADTRRNAHDFINWLQPDAVVFVKYEFWAQYLFELRRRQIPTLLVSALFRPDQPFFQWYGGYWRRMLGAFTHFFVQDEGSADLLRRIGLTNVTVAGDTRVDRVLSLAQNAPENAVVAAFTAQQAEGVFIAGSSWPADEDIFLPVLQDPAFQAMKIIVAPHEPSPEAVGRLGQVGGATALRYSEAHAETAAEARLLIIDNVGMLNTLYRYGSVAYIGGGFGRGIHNTLEPAAWGLPVIFGPRYQKFEEARQLVARGGAFAVRNRQELAAVLQQLQTADFYRQAVGAVRTYLEESRGATKQVVAFLGDLMADKR